MTTEVIEAPSLGELADGDSPEIDTHLFYVPSKVRLDIYAILAAQGFRQEIDFISTEVCSELCGFLGTRELATAIEAPEIADKLALHIEQILFSVIPENTPKVVALLEEAHLMQGVDFSMYSDEDGKMVFFGSIDAIELLARNQRVSGLLDQYVDLPPLEIKT